MMRRSFNRAVLAALLAMFVVCPIARSAAAEVSKDRYEKERAKAQKVAADIMAGKWAGNAISYSGYRKGQSPDTGPSPTKAQILEDLQILEKNWRLIRVYGSSKYTEDVLSTIREHSINLKVMLGIWLAKEPGNEAVNAAQVDNGIRLANEYEDVVFAVNVGNEVLIYWTAHPVPEENVLAYIRKVKANVSMPVTLADNYAWWISDGKKIAEEVDFLTIHSYPVWERKTFEEGLSFTIENINGVKAALPGKPFIIGEAGWPSYTEGNLHVPRTGNERNQKEYYEKLSTWAKEKGITVFFFSAFDEPWKGTGTEGHWGFFTEDRKAKLVTRELFPELKPNKPTSPSYSDKPVEDGGLSLYSAFRKAARIPFVNGTVNFHGSGISKDRCGESNVAREGRTSLKAEFNGTDWGGVYFMFDPVHTGSATNLIVSLTLPSNVATVEFKAEGPAGTSQSLNLLDFVLRRRENSWTIVSVPLAELNQLDLTQLSVLGFWNPRDSSGSYVSGTILIDDIHLQ